MDSDLVPEPLEWSHICRGSDSEVFTQTLMPQKGSVYNAEWGVQNKGVMILQRLRESNAKGQMIWFDNSLIRVEKDGWIFVDAPQAYAAVRVAKGGGKWKEDSISQRRDGRGQDGLGQWYALNNEFSPVIIEVVRKKDFIDFEDFQKAIMSNWLSFSEEILEYKSEFYDTTLTLPANYCKHPQIDGVFVNFDHKEVYESPFLKGDFGRGVVTIQNDTEKLTLNFHRN